MWTDNTAAFLSIWNSHPHGHGLPIEVESTIRLRHNAATDTGIAEHFVATDIMSIEQAEQLKQELTDKWVVVADQVPELRRFSSLTGKVRTVNMNCRALVEFDGPEDISWYDIDPQFLTVVEAPRPKAKAEEKAKPAADKPAAQKTAAKPAAGGSPLDQIRGGAAKPAAGGSPLDQIRGGGAAKPAAGGSPLDQIRGGGAAKPAAGGSPLDQIRAGGAAAAPKTEAEPVAEESPASKPPVAEAPAKPAVDIPAGASPLDIIRAQGGFKE